MQDISKTPKQAAKDAVVAIAEATQSAQQSLAALQKQLEREILALCAARDPLAGTPTPFGSADLVYVDERVVNYESPYKDPIRIHLPSGDDLTSPSIHMKPGRYRIWLAVQRVDGAEEK